MKENYEIKNEAEIVSRIREQDEKHTQSSKIFILYFSVTFMAKSYQLAMHWFKGSSIDSLWSNVALFVVSLIAIPVLIYRIRKMKVINYNIPVNELVKIAKKRYKPATGILILITVLLLLLVLIAPSMVEGHLPFVVGGLCGIVFGSIFCYIKRKRFIRSISGL